MNWRKITGLLLVGLGLIVLTLKLAHVYDPAPGLEQLSVKAGPAVARFVKSKPDLIVYILLVGLPACIGILFLSVSTEVAKEKTVAAPEPASSPSGGRVAKRKAQAAVHTATVL